MLAFFTASNAAVWVAVMVVFLIIEAATMGLTCIWFAIGALAAVITALFGGALWLQIIWFIVISIISLILTRPLVQKYINARSTPTNADMVIGMEALVTEDIDNLTGTGAVSVGGKIWTARSKDGEPIPTGTLVRAERIEGVKLIVSQAAAESEQAGAAL